MKYTYYARDFFSNSGSFDFSREHYCALLKNCFGICKFFSLLIHEDTDLIGQIEKWQILAKDFPFQNESHPSFRKYYYLNEYTKDFFWSGANSFFDFYHAKDHRFPEDPVFYREDRTVYLGTVAHEGECSIFPDSDEEILEILSFGHWLKMEGGTVFQEGIPSAPAIQHRLLPRRDWNLFQDPLYLILRELQKEPKSFIDSPNIHSLLSFIDAYCDSANAKMKLPTGAPRYVPRWYIAFRIYLLGEYDAKTNALLPDVMARAGLDDWKAYHSFFILLDKFSKDYANSVSLF